jgi:hypothetical protein
VLADAEFKPYPRQRRLAPGGSISAWLLRTGAPFRLGADPEEYGEVELPKVHRQLDLMKF